MDVLEVVLKESSYGYGFALVERTNSANTGESGFYIYDVLDRGNSDHSRSMLKAGDRLLAVNGINIKQMTATRIQDLLTESCQGCLCLTIQPQDSISNDPRAAILKNIPDYEKKSPPSILKRSLKKMRRIFEQPKGNFTVAVKRNTKEILSAQILGGSDEQILNGYSGIHVLNIGNNDFETVFGDETLQIGDRILSVNGLSLDDVPNSLVIDILTGRRDVTAKEIEQLKLMTNEMAESKKDGYVENEQIILLEANRLSSVTDEGFEDANDADKNHWCMSLLPTSPIAVEVLMIFTLSFFLSLF